MRAGPWRGRVVVGLLVVVLRWGVGRGGVGVWVCVSAVVVDGCRDGVGADGVVVPGLDAATAVAAVLLDFFCCCGTFAALALLGTDGALACRDGFGGREVADCPDPPFEVFASLGAGIFVVFALSALRRAGFFLGFLEGTDAGAGAGERGGFCACEGTDFVAALDAIADVIPEVSALCHCSDFGVSAVLLWQECITFYHLFA